MSRDSHNNFKFVSLNGSAFALHWNCGIFNKKWYRKIKFNAVQVNVTTVVHLNLETGSIKQTGWLE